MRRVMSENNSYYGHELRAGNCNHRAIVCMTIAGNITTRGSWLVPSVQRQLNLGLASVDR